MNLGIAQLLFTVCAGLASKLFGVMLMALKTCDALRIVKLTLAISMTMLSGCSSIPTMVPDMEMQARNPVQLDGAHGPLTAKQSKAILAKLEKDGEVTNIFDKHLALEAGIVGSPLMVGNKVELLVDGPSTYSAMFAAIENARDNINMETYIIEDDEVGRHFSALLVSKQKSGVQVNLIYDSVGSIYTPKEFFKPLQESGGNVLEFNPINPLETRKGWEVNRRDHRKLLIVDGQIAFVGGINISSVYSSGSFHRSKPDKSKLPWRDTHLRLEGPVVGEFQDFFMTTWSDQEGELLGLRTYYAETESKGNEVVRAIGSSPEDPYNPIFATLLSAINSAETQILLTNAYFVPDPQLLAALKDAAQRGVDVRLLLPGKTDSMLVYYASHSYYDDLLSSGVKIYERQEAFLHAKTVLIDGVWSTVGSTNLDWRSFTNNQEINAVLLGQDFGAKMQSLFAQDMESSQLLTLEAWRNRPILTRIKERLARLWARWL